MRIVSRLALSLGDMAMDECLTFMHNDLTPELIQYAEENINETEEIREKCVMELRKLLKENDDLDFEHDESIYLIVLRAKKFDTSKSIEYIRKCYDHVESNRKIFFRNSFDKLEKFFESNIFGFLKHRDPMGRAIMYGNPGVWNLDELIPDDVLFGSMVAIMSSIDNPVTQVAGYTVLLNLVGLQMKHVLAMSRWLVYGIVTVQRICPGFMKGFHIVYSSAMYKVVWDVVRPFISKKLKKRYNFHKITNISTIYEHLPQEILPVELGGGTPFSNGHWTEDIDNIVKRYTNIISHSRYRTN